jgi:MFS family permease
MKTKALAYHKLKSIHFVSAIVLLCGLADALISFYIPIQMQSYLHNLTLFGFLFGISAFTGACSDFILGYLSNRMRYITLMGIGMLLSGIVMLMALIPFSIILIIWLMIIWGLYYEFVEIGIFSYVSRYHHADEQSKFFGVIYLFMNMAYVIGPLVGGYLVLFGDKAVYGVAFVFLLIAFLFIPMIVSIHKKKERPFLTYKTHEEHFNIKKQIKKYKKIWKYASIFFIAAFLYNVWDSFVWTLIPIQSIGNNAIVSGIITATFTLPLALIIGYGGKIADKQGRKVTFILGLFVASLFTYIFGLQTNIILKVITAGLSSTGFAFAYPAMLGATAENGQEHEKILGDMAGVQRIFVNAGFITGPILGGFIGNIVGIQRAFSVLGAAMLICFIPIVLVMVHFHVTGRVHKFVLAEFEM